jgi:catechol 2,3-dioxygenase-like lactoylglutathione lyase family enzyme
MTFLLLNQAEEFRRRRKRYPMNKFMIWTRFVGLASFFVFSEVKSDDMKPITKKEYNAMSTVGIRYMIDDVPIAIRFYTTHLGFELEDDASPAFASVTRDGVRLLLSGKTSSGRRAMPDGRKPVPGGWNRIHIQVDSLEAEVKRLREAGLRFRNEIVTGPGGSQILLDDPDGNPVELFEPAARSPE